MTLSQKIFNIGANKTGTTTMQAIFEHLGLKVAPQREGELAGIDYEKGDFKPLNFYIQKYDAFQDVPFSTKSTFAVVDALFPGSKFILTYRDSEEWFNSFLNFHNKIMRIDPDLEKPRQQDFKKITYLAPSYLQFNFKHFITI